MKATVITEKGPDGLFACYVKEDLGTFGLAGYGETAEAAHDDLRDAYNDIRTLEAEEGRTVPDLEFVFQPAENMGE